MCGVTERINVKTNETTIVLKSENIQGNRYHCQRKFEWSGIFSKERWVTSQQIESDFEILSIRQARKMFIAKQGLSEWTINKLGRFKSEHSDYATSHEIQSVALATYSLFKSFSIQRKRTEVNRDVHLLSKINGKECQ